MVNALMVAKMRIFAKPTASSRHFTSLILNSQLSLIMMDSNVKKIKKITVLIYSAYNTKRKFKTLI